MKAGTGYTITQIMQSLENAGLEYLVESIKIFAERRRVLRQQFGLALEEVDNEALSSDLKVMMEYCFANDTRISEILAERYRISRIK